MRSSLGEGLSVSCKIFSWLLSSLGGTALLASSASSAFVVGEVVSSPTASPTVVVPKASNSRTSTNEVVLFIAIASLVSAVCFIRRNPDSLSSVSQFLSRSLFSQLADRRAEQARLLAEGESLRRRIRLFTEQNKAIIYSELSRDSDRDYNYEPVADTPDELVCPITREIMRVPVICAGRRYEYAAIKRWYDTGHHTDPMTRAPLTDPTSCPIDSVLRARIADYLLSRPRSIVASARAGALT